MRKLAVRMSLMAADDLNDIWHFTGLERDAPMGLLHDAPMGLLHVAPVGAITCRP